MVEFEQQEELSLTVFNGKFIEVREESDGQFYELDTEPLGEGSYVVGVHCSVFFFVAGVDGLQNASIISGLVEIDYVNL